jgi:phosphoribosylamine-glycine ligase
VKFAVYSSEGASLSWQRRLIDEGHEVLVYLSPLRFADLGKPFPQRHVGDGIVPKEESFARWQAWGRGGIYLFDSSGHAARAAVLHRRGERVVGSGDFCDKLEDDREFGFAIAEAMGIRVPVYHAFGSLTDSIAFAKKHDDCYVFKSNRYLAAGATYKFCDQADGVNYLEEVRLRWGDRISHILQEVIPGVALSTNRWWNGAAWVGPYTASIEHKKLLDGDRGPSTGCQLNFNWHYQDSLPTIAQKLNFEGLAAVWRKHRAPPGLYDINAVLHEEDGEPYFLEWTPRLGYDSEPMSQRGISDLGKFLEALAGGGDPGALVDRSKAHMGVRVTVPPYPAEDIEQEGKFVGPSIRGEDGLWGGHFLGYGVAYSAERGLYVSDPEGLAGIVMASGEDVEAFRNVYRFIDEKLRLRNVQCRRDAEDVVRKDLRAVARLGYETA